VSPRARWAPWQALIAIAGLIRSRLLRLGHYPRQRLDDPGALRLRNSNGAQDVRRWHARSHQQRPR
jgi:hypothetical protein